MAASGNALAAAQSANATQLGIAQAQADVANHAADAGLAAVQAQYAVIPTVVGLQTAAATAQNQTDADAAVSAANIAAGVANNQTAAGVTVAGINAGVANTTTAANLSAATLAAATTEQANNFAFELGSENIAANQTIALGGQATTIATGAQAQSVALGAQQVQEAQIASDTTLGTLTASNAALEAGYNYNLGVVTSNNATTVTDTANADALAASLAATQAAASVAIAPLALSAVTQNPANIVNIEKLTYPVYGLPPPTPPPPPGQPLSILAGNLADAAASIQGIG
jgi:hypothetical protein